MLDDADLAADGLKLSAEDIAALSAVSKPEVSDYPYGTGGVGQRSRKIAGGR